MITVHAQLHFWILAEAERFIVHFHAVVAVVNPNGGGRARHRSMRQAFSRVEQDRQAVGCVAGGKAVCVGVTHVQMINVTALESWASVGNRIHSLMPASVATVAIHSDVTMIAASHRLIIVAASGSISRMQLSRGRAPRRSILHISIHPLWLHPKFSHLSLCRAR